MPNLAMIAALSENFVIGQQQDLPWNLPIDLQHFKDLTLRKAIIMGRATFDSIGKALPNRRNIVLTRDRDFTAAQCEVVHSLAEVQALTAPLTEEVMIVGGAKIYELFMPYCNTMYLTFVHATVDGDTYFPRWVAAEWQEVARENHEADLQHKYGFSFVTLQRKT